MKPNKNSSVEKAKDFKASMKRLIIEIKPFKVFIILSLFLASIGSVISIFTPNILSDLTDKISEGLVVNSDNLEILSKKVSQNFSEEKINTLMPVILDIDLSKTNVSKILNSNEITKEDKEKFNYFISNISDSNIIEEVIKLPSNILNLLFVSSKYNNIDISISDKISFIKFLNNEENICIPKSIANILFNEIEIDGIKITQQEQAQFISLTKNISNTPDVEPNNLYGLIDKMPESIQTLVEPFMDMEQIKKISIILISLYLISALFTYIESICMTDVANKFAKKLRGGISQKINKLPLKYFDRNSKGDILSRVTNDVDTIAQSMNHSLATLVSAVTLFIGTIIMMFITNWVMAITAILSSLIGFIFMFSILGKSQKYFEARQKQLGNLNGHIEEIYSGLNVVKAYNGKKGSDEKFDELNLKLYESNKKSQFLSGLMQPLMGFIGNFGYVTVCIVGAILVNNDKISFGVIVAFIMYVRLFISPLSQIAQSMTNLQSTAAASERVFELFDEEEMNEQKNIKKVLQRDKVKGKIEFKNVVFIYDGNDVPTIKNFNATAYPGQKIAIVGPTGAGKTTMVNLLMKFYEINSGDIKIDGISIKELTRENVHNLFTMVLQDTWLFEGTVRENIAYNRVNITDDRIKEVCKIVGLDHFIKTLPNGYDSKISDSDSVSAGQRQLLTIARGMVENSPFLILDEATSNVDTRTEELVQNAMDKLTEGRTSFIIAHRLSTIKNADLILVMKDGNIIEQGTHEELLMKKGFYSELYSSQFEL